MNVKLEAENVDLGDSDDDDNDGSDNENEEKEEWPNTAWTNIATPALTSLDLSEHIICDAKTLTAPLANMPNVTNLKLNLVDNDIALAALDVIITSPCAKELRHLGLGFATRGYNIHSVTPETLTRIYCAMDNITSFPPIDGMAMPNYVEEATWDALLARQPHILQRFTFNEFKDVYNISVDKAMTTQTLNRLLHYLFTTCTRLERMNMTIHCNAPTPVLYVETLRLITVQTDVSVDLVVPCIDRPDDVWSALMERTPFPPSQKNVIPVVLNLGSQTKARMPSSEELVNLSARYRVLDVKIGQFAFCLGGI